MKDVIIEPIRSMLIPYFAEMKQTALNHNAIGFGISGSGPSVFALCKNKDEAEKLLSNFTNFFLLRISAVNLWLLKSIMKEQ